MRETHDGEKARQHHSDVVDPLGHRRAWSEHLRLDQGRHRDAGRRHCPSLRRQGTAGRRGEAGADRHRDDRDQRGLAAELGPSGVRVNALAPGIVATPLTRPIASDPMWNEAYAKRCALGRWAEPEEMAGPIIFLASDASSYLTGTTLFADAGWTAIDGRFEPQLKA